jgi:DNA-directed RNA polymerase subunit RPC12/RpoP
MVTYPFHGDLRIEHTKGITILYCGRCEKEFPAKIKEGMNDPTYKCPKCQVENKFNIKWKPL